MRKKNQNYLKYFSKVDKSSDVKKCFSKRNLISEVYGLYGKQSLPLGYKAFQS